MKKISICLISIFLFYQSSSLAYDSDPKNFIHELVNEAIDNLSNKNLNQNDKENFIAKVALDNVDINALALYTLGELRKSSDTNSISNYQKAFEKYFLRTLTSRLSDYSSSKFEILNTEKKSANYTIVSSKISPDDGSPEIKINWRVYTKH